MTSQRRGAFQSQGLFSTGSCNKIEIRRWMGQRYISWCCIIQLWTKSALKTEANDIICKGWTSVTCFNKKKPQLLNFNSCPKVSDSCTLCLQLSRFGCLGTFPGLAATQCCGRQGGKQGMKGKVSGDKNLCPNGMFEEDIWSLVVYAQNGWCKTSCEGPMVSCLQKYTLMKIGGCHARF